MFSISSKMSIMFTNKTIGKIGLCRPSRFGLRSPCSCSPRAVIYMLLVLFLLLLPLGFLAPVARCPISRIANVIPSLVVSLPVLTLFCEEHPKSLVWVVAHEGESRKYFVAFQNTLVCVTWRWTCRNVNSSMLAVQEAHFATIAREHSPLCLRSL